MRYALATLLFFVASPAWAQFACGAAVEYGKITVNDCLERGLPHCRTAGYLDHVWAMALKSQRVLEYGGCNKKENFIFDIYFRGDRSPYRPDGAAGSQAPAAKAPTAAQRARYGRCAGDSQMTSELENVYRSGAAMQSKTIEEIAMIVAYFGGSNPGNANLQRLKRIVGRCG